MKTERRRAKRREILDSFSFFVCVPKKGPHRLKVHDVSDLGIKFDFDDEAESPSEFNLKIGDLLDVQFYVNQSLFIPLKVKTSRIDLKNERRIVGAETTQIEEKTQNALNAVLQLIDQMTESGMVKAD